MVYEWQPAGAVKSPYRGRAARCARQSMFSLTDVELPIIMTRTEHGRNSADITEPAINRPVMPRERITIICIVIKGSTVSHLRIVLS